MWAQSIDEFLTTTLTVLEETNLDPVFDFSQADEVAQKIIIETFNSENVDKKLSDIISQNQLHKEDLIYSKSGIFDHHIHDNELSTSKVGTNAIYFCEALIHFVRQHLDDINKQEVFIPIALKWHIGVAVFNPSRDNIDSSIIVSKPTDSQWDNLEAEIIDEEWQSWGSKEYETRDDFMNEMDWGEIEVAVRDSWQSDEIKRIASSLKLGSTSSNVTDETEINDALEEFKSTLDDLLKN